MIIKYTYPDKTTGPAHAYESHGSTIPSAYLAQRDGETDEAWITRLAGTGITDVRRVHPYDGDINQYDAGDPVETMTDSGVIEVRYPNPVAKTTLYNTATREVMYVSEGQTVPAGYTTDVPPDDYPLWDAEVKAWTEDVDTAKADKLAEINLALTAIDPATVRPLRAILAADAAGDTRDSDDEARLTALEAQATTLRATRAEVEAMTVLADILAVTVD